MRNFLSVFLVVISMIVFGGCGGGGGDSGGGSSELTGKFIDAPVQGLKYSCSPSGLSGVTGENGEFKYKTGDKITFKVGGISLGEINAADIITPYSYTSVESEALKMVRFILSAASSWNDTRITLKDNPYPGVEGLYTDKFGELESDGKITVDESTAKEHFKPKDPNSKIKGTYRIESISEIYQGKPMSLVITGRTPETFPAEVIIESGGKYKISVNNGTEAMCTYSSNGGNGTWHLMTFSGWTKIGDSDKYEVTISDQHGTSKSTIEVLDANKVVGTEEWTSTSGTSGVSTTVLTRVGN